MIRPQEKVTIDVPPQAAILVLALRDIGYTFSTAIADIIDNSIDSEAKTVKISTGDFGGEHPFIVIADDGQGMNEDQLVEALRFGSNVDHNLSGLGKFGLGLKTSSFSQCRRVTVLSRKDQKEKWNGMCWDLDHVLEKDMWEVLKVDTRQLPNFNWEMLLKIPHGTIVIWENLDRVFLKKDKFGLFEDMPATPYKLIKDLDIHLGMVFHRFLNGEVPEKHLSIEINSSCVKPWDPFARNEKDTLKIKKSEINIESLGAIRIFSIIPYILPHESQFSSTASFKAASGPKKWNSQQGFYIYRQDRLIQSGGWCGLWTTNDEHSKLLRVCLDFSPELDEAFQINITKTQVTLPPSASDQIISLLKSLKTQSDDRYRNAGLDSKKNRQPQPPQPPQQSQKPSSEISSTTPNTGYNLPGRHVPASIPLDVDMESQIKKLLKFADNNERAAIINVLKKFYASGGN